MVGWDAGVRLGARAAAPSPSAAEEEEGGVWSRNAPSSRGKQKTNLCQRCRKHAHVDATLLTSFTCTTIHTDSGSEGQALSKLLLRLELLKHRLKSDGTINVLPLHVSFTEEY